MGLLDKLKKDKKEGDKKKSGEKSANAAGAKKESVKRAREDKKTAEEKSAKKRYGNAHRVLVRPLVTEKASVMGALGKYFFEVAGDANKIEIAKAIQDVYGVKPISVNIIRMRGKRVRRGRTIGKRKDWKKAVITLKKGESIKVYEGV